MVKKKKEKKQSQGNIPISMIINNLSKRFGKGVVIKPSDKNEMQKLFLKDTSLSTGNISLDHMTGIGGMPLGRIIEVYGREGAGKTSLCLIMSGIAQKKGAFVLYVDAESRVDLSYAQKLGIDIDDDETFAIIRPDNSDHVYMAIDEVLSMNQYCAIIVDSIPAILPKTKADVAWGESSALARQALEMNNFLQRCNPKISKTQALFMFTNQLRAKSAGGFGFYLGATGGNAIKYYSTLRININWNPNKETDLITDDDGNKIGCYMEYKFDKTNTSIPPRPRKICFKFGVGYWNTLQAVECGIQEQIIRKDGSWLSYGEGKNQIKAQGKMNMVKELESDEKLYKKIENDIKKSWGITKP